MKTILANLALILAAVALATSGCGSPPNVNSNVPSTNTNTVATSSPVPAAGCDDSAITESLKKTYANQPFTADAKNFNFFSRGCIVTLYGGVRNDSVHAQAIQTAEAEKKNGVIKVDRDRFFSNTTVTSKPVQGSCACPTGYRACGDICIPDGDPCNAEAGVCGNTPPKPLRSPTP